MTIALIVGTRPEAIKLAPIAELLGEHAHVIHTGQHYSTGMTGDLPAARVQLRPLPHDTTRGQQLGHLTSEIATVFHERPPEAVIVQGDTTSALAGALAANAAAIPLVHVEAGLRSFDRGMPEEHNRVLIDHLADLCCAPTTTAADNLRAERIPTERIVITGNTIVEAATRALPAPHRQVEILEQLGVTTQRYILATVHRPENADDPVALEQLLAQLTNLPVPVVLPLHPRTRRLIEAHGLADLANQLRITEPLDYPDTLALIQHAAVVTDSGGIQEEATILARPVVIIRHSNERPEVEVDHGVRMLPAGDIACIISGWLSDIEAVHDRLRRTPSPYGDGTASAQIVYVIWDRVVGRRDHDFRQSSA